MLVAVHFLAIGSWAQAAEQYGASGQDRCLRVEILKEENGADGLPNSVVLHLKVTNNCPGKALISGYSVKGGGRNVVELIHGPNFDIKTKHGIFGKWVEVPALPGTFDQYDRNVVLDRGMSATVVVNLGPAQNYRRDLEVKLELHMSVDGQARRLGTNPFFLKLRE